MFLCKIRQCAHRRNEYEAILLPISWDGEILSEPRCGVLGSFVPCLKDLADCPKTLPSCRWQVADSAHLKFAILLAHNQIKIERSSEQLRVQRNQYVTGLLKIRIFEQGGSLVGTARKAARMVRPCTKDQMDSYFLASLNRPRSLDCSSSIRPSRTKRWQITRTSQGMASSRAAMSTYETHPRISAKILRMGVGPT